MGLLHTNPADLLEVHAEKWLLLDTSAINILVEEKVTDFWRALEGNKITPCYIEPVALELTAYRDTTVRTKRLEIIGKLNLLPILPKDFVTARTLQNTIQSKIASKECQPSPTDLYIGAVASRFKEKLIVATADMNDFPTPIYKRLGYLIIETPTRVRLIAFLAYQGA